MSYSVDKDISGENKTKSTPWFVCPQTNPEAEMRLFFFPYAGGGPPAFSQWSKELPRFMEGVIAHYPGRGSRYQEPAINDLSTLVDKLSPAIRTLSDKPFAFFGHSLGGLVSFELTRQLGRYNLPQPQILFIAACGAPHLTDPHPSIHQLPDAEFLKSIKALNGIPSELQDNPNIIELFLPTLRADFQVVESYVFNPDDSSIDRPIIVYGGLDDPRVSRERLEGWASLTKAVFKSQRFPGDHFFINTARDSVIASIAAELESFHAKR